LNQNYTSIFGLSSSEKLQLVQDFRDDLPAKPGAIPVDERQKEKLAGRKANLAKNPTAGLTWEEIKKRVRSLYGR